jgi:hypothetical protein
MGFSIRRFGNSIPVAGGFLSSIWGDPDKEKHQRSIEQAGQQIAQYRPELMNSRMNSISQMAGAFEPMNQLMQQMYGGGKPGAGPTGGMMDIQSMINNPMTQGMQDQMYQAAFGRGAPPGQGAPPPGFANGQNPQAANLPFGLPPLGQRK